MKRLLDGSTIKIFGISIALDFITKQWIRSSFGLGVSVDVIPSVFNITHVKNYGVAFGMFSRLPEHFRLPFLLVLSSLSIGVLLLITIGTSVQRKWERRALAVAIGGAMGNLLDRAVFGHVTDFLDFHWNSLYHFPAFNLADIAICLGVGTFLVVGLLRNESTAVSQQSQ